MTDHVAVLRDLRMDYDQSPLAFTMEKAALDAAIALMESQPGVAGGELPDLPRPSIFFHHAYHPDGYSAQQMREFAIAALATQPPAPPAEPALAMSMFATRADYEAAKAAPPAVDGVRLEWLLGRMNERQLNDILGGYRMVFTTRCARAAIDHALNAERGQGVDRG